MQSGTGKQTSSLGKAIGSLLICFNTAACIMLVMNGAAKEGSLSMIYCGIALFTVGNLLTWAGSALISRPGILPDSTGADTETEAEDSPARPLKGAGTASRKGRLDFLLKRGLITEPEYSAALSEKERRGSALPLIFASAAGGLILFDLLLWITAGKYINENHRYINSILSCDLSCIPGMLSVLVMQFTFASGIEPGSRKHTVLLMISEILFAGCMLWNLISLQKLMDEKFAPVCFLLWTLTAASFAVHIRYAVRKKSSACGRFLLFPPAYYLILFILGTAEEFGSSSDPLYTVQFICQNAPYCLPVIFACLALLFAERGTIGAESTGSSLTEAEMRLEHINRSPAEDKTDSAGYSSARKEILKKL